MDFRTTFALLIYLTKRNNITFSDIGDALNVGRAAISKRAERNSKFKPSELEKIEEYFDIKLKDAYITTNTWQQPESNNVIKNYEFFGHRLAEVQDELGYLDKAMARIMGIDEKRYIDIKLGDCPATVDELAQLCSKIDISIDWLVKGE